MNADAQRIAIAEFCGWKHHADGGYYIGDQHPTFRGGLELPNYLENLNAMHEAEKVLTDTQQGEYQTHLDKICFIPRNGIDWEAHMAGIGWNHDERVYATAAQRAEAFLRTLNLWKD